MYKIFEIISNWDLCFITSFYSGWNQQDIQFKLNSKYQLFNLNAAAPNFNGIDLLATASAFGLIIVGRPATAEIDGLFFIAF